MTRDEFAPDRARAALAGVRGGDDDQAVDAYARAVWSSLVEPGDGIAGRLLATVGAADALRIVVEAQVAPPAGTGVSTQEWKRALERWSPRVSSEGVAAGLRTASHAGVRLVIPADDAWPHRVADLGDHGPICLWVRGMPAACRIVEAGVAMVGARAATSYGEHVAGELAGDLAAAGVTIVSGGAYGIDAAAHRAALGAGGTTVALSAGGVDRPYPAGHAHLLGRVAASGAVVSEVPCGGAPTRWRFLQRNRLIAAMADAVVVVEAGWRSGSLNTAGHAAALGRPLGAVPGPITSAASAGAHRLIREFGAECVTGADDVRELLGIGPRMMAGTEDGHTDERTRVRDALSSRVERSPLDIAARTGLAHAEVEAVLGLLHLEGVAAPGAGGWRRAARTR